MPRLAGRLTRIMAVSCERWRGLDGRSSVEGGQVRRGTGGDGELQGELRYRVVVSLSRRSWRGNLLRLLLSLRLHWLYRERLRDVRRWGGFGSVNTGVSTSIKAAETITGTICIV